MKKEKQYIVICDNELWVKGTRRDVMVDFIEDSEAYIQYANNIKIYELGEPIPFTFITPQINF